MRTIRPIVEAYIQETSPEVDGVQMPLSDSYFLGRLEWREGPVLALMADTRRVGKSAGERRGFIPDGFAADGGARLEVDGPRALRLQVRAPRVPRRGAYHGVRRDPREGPTSPASRAASGSRTAATTSSATTA